MSEQDYDGHKDDDAVTQSLMGLFAPPPASGQTDSSSLGNNDASQMSEKSQLKSRVGKLNEKADETEIFAEEVAGEVTNATEATEQVSDDKDDSERRDTLVSSNKVKRDAAAASASFQSLFEPPRSPSTSNTARKNSASSSFQSLFEPPRSPRSDSFASGEDTPLLSSSSSFGSDTVTPKVRQGNRKASPSSSSLESSKLQDSFYPIYTQPLPPIEELNQPPPPVSIPTAKEMLGACQNTMNMVLAESINPSTWIGSAMFVRVNERYLCYNQCDEMPHTFFSSFITMCFV